VWLHGDVTASNLLVADGALHAVIDFCGVALGDPACDLAMKGRMAAKPAPGFRPRHRRPRPIAGR
jgi:aminoglycoside phosphotransferase (APT) family kinase protein